MNRTRLIALAIAAVAALLAVFLVQGLFASDPPPAPVADVKSNKVDVLVASKDLAQGEKLGSFGLQWRPWPRDNVVGNMITSETLPDAIETLKDARARLPLVTGEPIVESRIVRPGDRGFMAAILPRGMRGIAIEISDNSAVGGFILPNDRVDVILTRRGGAEGGSDSQATSETIFSNVKVLAINQSLISPDDGPAMPGGGNAVVELEPRQAEILTKIAASGELSLVLRSLAEEGDSGVADERPVLSDAFMSRRKNNADGPLLIRYGREELIKNR